MRQRRSYWYSLLGAIFLTQCSWEPRTLDTFYTFPTALQPLYVEPVDNFKDARLCRSVEQQFNRYDVAITHDRSEAHSILRLCHITRQTNKAVTNNMANNQSIFYKSGYNATVRLSFPLQPKRPAIILPVIANTPVILLENQNIFSSADTQQIFQELERDLSNQIAREVFFALQPVKTSSASTKKTV